MASLRFEVFAVDHTLKKVVGLLLLFRKERKTKKLKTKAYTTVVAPIYR